MYKFILILLSFFSFSTFANSPIKAISGIKYFPPTPYSTTGMNAFRAGTLRGGVTVGSAFAVAKIKPASILGLGRQLASSNPYTLVAMAALTYYQDDIGRWVFPPEEEGEQPYLVPDIEQVPYGDCYSVVSTLVTENKCLENVEEHYTELLTQRVAATSGDSSGSERSHSLEIVYQEPYYIGKVTYDRCKKTWPDGSTMVCEYIPAGTQDAFFSDTYEYSHHKDSAVCPPDMNPTFLDGVDTNSDGEVDRCYDPAESHKYEPQPIVLSEAVEPYADDLMEWHNTSIESLQNWEPYLDTSGNVEPQYVESYNQPDVSATMNEYMKNVSSGNYQTSDATAPNYVPSEMLQPTQSAINSTFNNESFVDPTTSIVVDPTISTDGAATPDPVPTGGANSPIHVTGDITVNVEIPEDDTISQTEYEASNAKFFEQFNTQAQLEQTKIDTQLTDLEAADSDFIDSLTADVTNFGVPDFPTLANIWPSFSTGTCIPLTLNASVARLNQTIVFDAHCPPYNTYIHPLLVWILYLMTGLYVFHLAHETLGRK